MPTIIDVAKLAGVSRTTVSRVLNQSSKVDAKTRKDVLDAIERLKYEPSHTARNLRKQQTRLIAVLVPDISNPFFAGLLEGMESVCLEFGYKIVLCITGDQRDREMQYIRMLESRQVDGVILTALRNPIQHILPYRKFGPILFANEYADGDPLPSVAIDNIASAHMAVNHFISMGHKRIAFINGPEHIIICRDRKKGYRDALSEAAIPIQDDLYKDGGYTMEGGFRCTLALLGLPDPPTAIFAGNDTMGVGVIQAIHKTGLRVPHDIMIVGFDNNPFSTVIEPNLTTVDIPTGLMGAEAVRQILTCLELGTDKVKPKRTLLETKLIVRHSSTR